MGYLTVAKIGNAVKDFSNDVIFCVSKDFHQNILSMRFMIDRGYSHIPRKGLFKVDVKSLTFEPSMPVLETSEVLSASEDRV